MGRKILERFSFRYRPMIVMILSSKMIKFIFFTRFESIFQWIFKGISPIIRHDSFKFKEGSDLFPSSKWE